MKSVGPILLVVVVLAVVAGGFYALVSAVGSSKGSSKSASTGEQIGALAATIYDGVAGLFASKK